MPYDTEDELQEFRYTIPEGYEAEIVDGQVVIKKKVPELTEFEQSVRSCIVEHLTTRTKTADGGEISSTVFISDATAQEIAKELLDHAKKELCKGCVANLKGYIKGRQDALKELDNVVYKHVGPYMPTYSPCHYGGECTNPFYDCINCPRNRIEVGFNTQTACSKENIKANNNG